VPVPALNNVKGKSNKESTEHEESAPRNKELKELPTDLDDSDEEQRSEGSITDSEMSDSADKVFNTYCFSFTTALHLKIKNGITVSTKDNPASRTRSLGL
jgi:hypothetical protein